MVIKTLWIVIAIISGLFAMQSVSIYSIPNRLRLYVPPNLSRGADLKVGKIPASNVYGFVYQIFLQINSWPKSGTKNYLSNIHNYRNYLSNRFYHALMQDEQRRANDGELGRKRIMSGVAGYPYTPSDVKSMGDGTWEVDIPLQIQESVNRDMVKNVIIDYSFLVSRVHESILLNPMGMVISGFAKRPYRLKTIV